MITRLVARILASGGWLAFGDIVSFDIASDVSGLGERHYVMLHATDPENSSVA